MVVAQIAYNHLDPEVKAKCDALIAVPPNCGTLNLSYTFVGDSTWADQRCDSYTSPQHFIDLPISLDGHTTNSATINLTNNVVTALNQYIATLQNTNATLTAQATALRYVIHFAGDIEQPLHCSNGITSNNFPNGDSGGNGFSLGSSGSLHSFWDNGGGYLSGGTVSDKAASIEALYPYSPSIGTIPNPMDWATDGWNIARTNTYVGITNGQPPSASYTTNTQATTIWRMAVGGQRLAKLLNTIYVTNAPSVTSVSLTDGNFGLSWSSVSGRIYRVQWKQQITDPTWNDLTDVTASTNSTSFTTNSVAQPQQFYRAIVVN